MKKTKAFTLIETIIVIAVFCIGILTVLFGLSQTLRNKDYANTQIKSAFFAREGIEMMFNLRDANYHKELPWNCIFKSVGHMKSEYNEDENPFCSDILKDGKILKIGMGSKYIDVVESTELNGDFEKDFENFQIYLHTGNVLNGSGGFIYNHDSTDGEETGFARYIKISNINEDGKVVDTNKILKVESHVLYKKGALTGERVMETFMGYYEF